MIKKILKIVLVLLTIGAIVFVMTFSKDLKNFFTKAKSLEHDGVTRQYRVHTPPNYDESLDYPVVVALHGYKDRGRWIEFYTGFSHAADENEFIVVYPEGIKNSWNGTVCCGNGFENKPDDVGFISKMMDKIQENYSVNPERFYITGFSNGGNLAQRLLSETNLFNRGAIVMSSVGSPGNGKIDISGADEDLVIINGEDDRYIPVNNRPPSGGFEFLAARETLKDWREQLGLENTEPKRIDAVTHIYESYSKPSATLDFYLFRDQPHRWPGSRLYQREETPEATEIIVEFFKL